MTGDRIEIGVEVLRELVLEDSRLAAELATSRARFFGGREPEGLEPPAAALAERRHFEWFAFERPTEAEGIPAAHELFDAWFERVDGETQLLSNALLHSRTGIFEVAEIQPGEGLWLNDLLGRGTFPVDEPEATAELAVGDLLAGRIFPVGDSQFRLSPAVACFRNPDLREAIRRDLEQLASERRGTLRIAQIEIERMFFGRGGGRSEAGAGAAEADELATRLTTLLVDGGVEQERAEAWVENLRETAAAAARAEEDGAGVRNHLLEGLAFDTSVDLGAARELLPAAWSAFARAAAARPEDAAPAGVPVAGADETGPTIEHPDAVRRALENYDRGREQGQGLDQLFDALERELGLDDEDDADAGEAPDVPGVVGAMVREFVWESAHGGQALGASEQTMLEGLAEYTRDIGLFELLTADHLRGFAARWSLDRGRVSDEDGARALLDAVSRFARWADEEHDLELWKEFEELAKGLERSLPRVVQANALLGVSTLDVGDPDRRDVVEDVASGTVGVRDTSGAWRPLEAPDSVGALVREGDQVACQFDGERARPLRIYPPEARVVD
ncbi:MAG: hypothetical protein AAFZ65_00940 [Planctomycetota bacterium]